MLQVATEQLLALQPRASQHFFYCIRVRVCIFLQPHLTSVFPQFVIFQTYWVSFCLQMQKKSPKHDKLISTVGALHVAFPFAQTFGQLAPLPSFLAQMPPLREVYLDHPYLIEMTTLNKTNQAPLLILMGKTFNNQIQMHTHRLHARCGEWTGRTRQNSQERISGVEKK